MLRTKKRRSSKELVRIYGPAVFLTLVGFLIAYQFVDPAPPKHLRMGTGGPSGAYFAFGQRYREILSRSGIDLEVLSTAGSVENVERLRRGELDFAFVQGGILSGHEDDDLVSLGSTYFEPLWVFHRRTTPLERLNDLRGRTVAVGPTGSGTRAVALQLLETNGLLEIAEDGSAANAELTLSDASGSAAETLLREGAIDALFVVAGAESPLVRGLLESEDVRLMSFQRADAYTRVHRFLSQVELPEGVIDFERNLPRETITLLSPTANLVARADLHPALHVLLLQVADEVHRGGGLFERAGQFPSARYLDVALSPEAQRYHELGPSLLQRYLPFWAATLIDRLKVMLLPLVALLIPLFRLMPPIYRWRVRSRIYRWYRDILAIEADAATTADVSELRACESTLEQMEDELRKIHIPLSYAEELYNLKFHVSRVRDGIRARIPN